MADNYVNNTRLQYFLGKVKDFVNTTKENLQSLISSEASTRSSADKALSDRIDTLSSGKVDKVAGKGLSTNDYTTDEKNKLANIASGAEVNVQSDWNAASGDAMILNKPSIPTKVSDLTNDSNFQTNTQVSSSITTAIADKVDKIEGKGLSTNDYTTDEKNKLAGIETGAQVNVQADWEAESGGAQILHRPTIPTKTSDLTNDSHFVTEDDIPEGSTASTSDPAMDGVASPGVALTFARGDHVHPSDTTKVDKVTGKGLSTNDFTDSYKEKLDDIEAEANKTIVDSAMTDNSTNPVQNGIVKAYIDAAISRIATLEGKATTLEGKVSTLEGKVSTLESKVSALETEASTRKTLVWASRN